MANPSHSTSPSGVATQYLYRLVTMAPLLWVGAFVAFVLRAWVALGTLPRPYRPDPKDLGFTWHQQLIYFGFLAALATLVIFPWFWRQRGVPFDAVKRRYGFWFATGWVLVMIVTLIDPGSFFSWFLD